MAALSPRASDRSDDGVTHVDGDDVQTILSALDDADCRRIMEAADGEALSASEVSEACDLPLSTTYRKLELLSDAGFLAEETRLRRSGKHVSEYSRIVDDVVVSVGGEGIELHVTRRTADTPVPLIG